VSARPRAGDPAQVVLPGMHEADRAPAPASTKAAFEEAVAWTDGACSGNPGPGGYGVVLVQGGARRELAKGFRHTTNNRMEILAVIAALEALERPSRVVVHSDSQYVVNAIELGWAKKWRANGWRRGARGSDRAQNPDLWQRLLELLERSGHRVELDWVRGHAGDADNERADRLAVEALRGERLEVDERYESAVGRSKGAR
jgi:ribonuclease HI